jgi:hypothetical protein
MLYREAQNAFLPPEEVITVSERTKELRQVLKPIPREWAFPTTRICLVNIRQI